MICRSVNFSNHIGSLVRGRFGALVVLSTDPARNDSSLGILTFRLSLDIIVWVCDLISCWEDDDFECVLFLTVALQIYNLPLVLSRLPITTIFLTILQKSGLGTPRSKKDEFQSLESGFFSRSSSITLSYVYNYPNSSLKNRTAARNKASYASCCQEQGRQSCDYFG